MPKDTQVSYMSPQDGSAYLRRFSYLSRRQQAPYLAERRRSGRDETGNVDSAMDGTTDDVEIRLAALSLDGSSQKDAREILPASQETPAEPGVDRMDLSEGEALVLPEGRDVPSTELGSPMKQSSSNEIPIQQQRGSSVRDRGAMDRETKRSASLHRRILVLEKRERMLKSELKMQRRAITSFAADAREAYHQLAVVELECEYSKRDAWDRATRYCKWWLSDFQALKDLLEFVAEPNHPDVERIMSSSRERFAAYRGNNSDTAMI